MPFTPKFVDMVRNLTTSTGTGAVNPGSAVSGFTSLSAAVATGEQFYYCIQGVDKPAEREVGRGTMLVNGTIAREPISGPLFNFSVGTKTIALVTAAEWFAKAEAGGSGGGSMAVASLAELSALPIVNGAAAMLTAKGREGLFVFDTSNLSAKVTADTRKGIYVAPSSAPTGAAGAWVRKYSGAANVDWWGAVADDLGYLGSPTATDNADAFDGALATLKERANAVLTIEKLSEPLFFDGHYYTSRTINLKQAIRLVGTGTKYSQRTRLRFPINKDGIVVNETTTFGSIVEAASTNAAGALIEGIHLLGGGGTQGHGFRLRNRGLVRDGGARNFGQDGVHIFAWSGGGGNPATYGNANCFSLDNLNLFANGRHGVFAAGSEGNAGYGSGIDASYNGGFGILDMSFLGSFWLNCHTDNNGRTNYVTNAGVASGSEAFNGGWTKTNTQVNHAGRVWMALLGREKLASTTTPGTDASVWQDLGAGTNGGLNAWSSGIIVRPGGAYGASGFQNPDATALASTDPADWYSAGATGYQPVAGGNANSRAAFKNVYAEGGQPFCQVNNAGSIEGFIEESPNIGSGVWIRTGEGTRHTLSSGLETRSGDSRFVNGAVLATGHRDFGGFVGGAGFYRNNASGLFILGGAGTSTEMVFATAGGATIAYCNTGSTDFHLSGLVLDPAAPPAAPNNGQIWYDSVLGKFRKREGGVTSDLAGGGVSDGDKGDVVVAGSGGSLTVESATPSDGSFNVAGRVKITANGAFGSSQIYRDAVGGINIVGVTGSSSDLTFYTPVGATVFQNPSGTVNSDFYGNVNVAAGKVFKVNGTQVVAARQTGTAADATDLATAIALVNDLKAKLVTHGLVS